MVKTVTGELVAIDWKKNSYLGNPRAVATVAVGCSLESLDTGSNSPVACWLSESYCGRLVKVTYHVTKAGRLIVDKMELAD